MLKSRLIIGLPLVVMLVLAIFWPGEAGAAVFAGLAGAGIFAAFTEYSGMAESLGITGPHNALKYFGLLLLLVIIYSPFASMDGNAPYPAVLWPGELLILAVAVMFCFMYVVRADSYAAALPNATAALAGLVVIYGGLNFIGKLYFSAGLGQEGRYLVLFVAGATKAGDVGAYGAGMLTARRAAGNHKIVPRISPKKSWEGLGGGIIASTLTALIIYAVFGRNLLFCDQQVLGLGSVITLGGLFGLLGFFGDISVSALKRAANFDDSGSIPGLGGVLDMVDSLLFVLPVFYAFISARAIF
ncbi:MAG: phosphatidate cytidylyltransferase [Lentisphaeria bacterium]